MSWRYLPEQVEVSLGGTSAGLKQSAMSSGKNTALKSSKHGSKTKSTKMHQSGMMSRPSTGNPGLDQWILSQEAFLANHSVKQEKGWEKMIQKTCGLRPLASLAKSDQNGAYLKMSRPSLGLILDKLSQTFPKSGIMYGGVVYQLPQLERLTKGKGSGLWLTPITTDYNGATEHVIEGVKKGKFHLTLARKVNLIENTITGKLNPVWVEWLMGWPMGVTKLKPLAMDRYQRWLKQFGK